MEGLLLIFYTFSIAIACLTLGLSVANAIFHRAFWCRWYVVCQACILGTIVLGFVNSVSDHFFGAIIKIVFDYIFTILQHLTAAFVVVLIPFFLKWLIGLPWKAFHYTLAYTSGTLYLAVGLISVLLHNSFYAQIVQVPIFVAVCLYCVYTLRKKIYQIDDKTIKNTCTAINIATLCIIMLEAVALVFPDIHKYGYLSYILALSIIMLTYFYNVFRLDSTRLNKKPNLNESEISKYKITEREMTVIKQICDGYTNKEIAANLNISVNTVNNHVSKILEKTGVRSRIDLVRMLKVEL